MKLSHEEAYLILNNLDSYVAKFERTTRKKVTPGAMQIIQEILTEASFPKGSNSENLH